MQSFEEKIRLLEQKKQEYRRRLSALKPSARKAVEDTIWEEASDLAPFMSGFDKRKPEVQLAQKGLMEAFEKIRNLGKNVPISGKWTSVKALWSLKALAAMPVTA